MKADEEPVGPVTIVVPRDVALVFEAWASQMEETDFPGFELHDSGAIMKLHALFEKELVEFFMSAYPDMLEHARRSLRKQMGGDDSTGT